MDSDDSARFPGMRLHKSVAEGVRQAAAFALLAALLGAEPSWAVDEVAPGTAMASVRFSSGIPDAIRFDSAGRQAWEYTGRGAPSGAYRLTFDAKGAVSEAIPLRTPERLARVRTGETTGVELVELLGEPGRITVTEAGAVWLFPRAGGKSVVVTLGADRRVKSLSGFD